MDRDVERRKRSSGASFGERERERACKIVSRARKEGRSQQQTGRRSIRERRGRLELGTTTKRDDEEETLGNAKTLEAEESGEQAIGVGEEACTEQQKVETY